MDGLEPVARLRRVVAGHDRYGNPHYSTAEEALPGALFAPRHVVPASEAGRQVTIVEPTLYWEGVWPDVVASDRLRVRGQVFEVVAVPSEWRGHLAGGLTVTLRACVEGVA